MNVVHMDPWAYDNWPSGEPYAWEPACRGVSPFDTLDFHVDLGCGKLKKGRIGIDRFDAPGVDLVLNFESEKLPFADSSIESIVTHHCLEHIGPGFLPLMDECYRVLKPGGLFRIIVPLFPSHAAVADPDHKRYFLEGTFESFCGTPENCWLESFSVPYTNARFEMVDKDMTPPTAPEIMWTKDDAREIRVALKAVK